MKGILTMATKSMITIAGKSITTMARTSNTYLPPEIPGDAGADEEHNNDGKKNFTADAVVVVSATIRSAIFTVCFVFAAHAQQFVLKKKDVAD
jgi:hypothetical protein